MATKLIGSTGHYSNIKLWTEGTAGVLAEDEIGEHQDETIAHGTNNVVFSGATYSVTQGAYHRELKPVAGAYYDPKDSSGAASTWTLAGQFFQCYEAGLIIEGLGLKHSNTSATTAVTAASYQPYGTSSGATMRMRRCVLDSTGTNATLFFLPGSGAYTNFSPFIYNNIVTTNLSGDGGWGIRLTNQLDSGKTRLVASNTVWRIDRGGSTPGDGIGADAGGTNNGTIIAVNNCVFGSTGADFATMTNLSGTHTEDYNGSEDTSSAGANSITGLVIGDWVDPDNGDFTPASAGALIEAGDDLSAYFTDDFYGTTRPAAKWDMGAVQYTTGGGTPVTVNPTVGTIAFDRDGDAPPTLKVGVKVNPTLDGIPLAGTTPSVTRGVVVSPAAGGIAVFGPEPTVIVAGTVTVEPDPGTVSLAGVSPAVEVGVKVSVSGPGAIPVAADAPAVKAGVKVYPVSGGLSLAASLPSILRGVAVAPSPGSVALGGVSASVAVGVRMTPAAGSLPLSAPGPSTLVGVVVAPTPGTIGLTAPVVTVAVSGTSGFRRSAVVGTVVTAQAFDGNVKQRTKDEGETPA